MNIIQQLLKNNELRSQKMDKYLKIILIVIMASVALAYSIGIIYSTNILNDESSVVC